jgi:hypothetical protein
MANNDFQYKPINTQYQPVQSEQQSAKKGDGLMNLFNKRNLPKTSAILIVVGILIIIAAIIWGRSSFSKSRVDLSITAPDNISSGEETILTVKYKNNNRVSLNDVHIIINYPQGSFSSEGKEAFQDDRNLGTIGKKAEGEENFKIRLLGEKGNIKNITVKLNYKPQNINSRFENVVSLKAEINTILIGIHIEGSEKAVAGQQANYAIEYENKTEEIIDNLRIKLEYPDDFQFKNSEPAPKSKDENDIWEVGSLRSGGKKTINLVGILSGQEMENKVMKGFIGRIEDDNFIQYSQSEFITQISPAPIVLVSSIDGIEDECKVDAGQQLRYRIKFKNNTDVALRELILKAYLKDSIFDVKEIKLDDKGFFDSRNNMITWSGADIPQLNLLEPSQSGEVSFSIKIKESMPILSFNDKNFKADIIAEIQTLTVPAKFAGTELKFENELSCKINSQLNLQTKVYYYEPSQGIYNNGPIPPKVNALTTYTIHWQITNTSNDLDNIRVKTTLPQGISWTNYQINKLNKGQVSYNERTKEVIWDIGRISAGAGITMPMYELIFQIGLTPSINQVGQTPVLINESSIEGKDLFTGLILTKSTSSINTALPDDSKVGYNNGKVVE